MALAAEIPRMITGDDHSLHPFFLAAKNNAAFVDANPQLPEKRRKPRSDVKDAESKESVATRPRGRPKKKQPSLSSQRCGERLQGTESEVGAPDKKEISPSRTSEVLNLQNETHGNFVINLNADRRKRRRTSSPGPTTARKLGCELSRDKQIQQAISTADASGVTLSKRPKTGSKELGSLPKKERDTTPETKVLKLWADGKLRSPNSRANPRKAKKKGEAGDQRGGLAARITIIKYGYYETSRQAIGRRISDILTSPLDKTIGLRESPKKPRAVTGAPKATHPFFYSKTHRPNEKLVDLQNIRKTDGNLSESSFVDETGPVVPKPSMPTSKNRVEAWSQFGGLGSCSSSISSNMKIPKYLGATEPLWPPKGMVHTRGSFPITSTTFPNNRLPSQKRKLKGNKIQIFKDESVLRSCNDITHAYRGDVDLGYNADRHLGYPRRPRRRIMTGVELQEAIREKVGSILPLTVHETKPTEFDSHEAKGCLRSQPTGREPTHRAILQIFDSIATSLSAFDRFECETQEWAHKYSPKYASTVLQKGREAVLLRDWLSNLTVTSIDSGNRDVSRARESSIIPKQYSSKARRRKRKRTDELAEFILSSDEENVEMEELTETEDPVFSQEDEIGIKKSVIRSRETPSLSQNNGISARNANAVVVSGPHGCGKTAAIYAVAKELGFEIFEINAGTRRSGKDLIDRVGDMTKNHLVHRAPEQEDLGKQSGEPNVSVEREIDSGHQRIMSDFLKSKVKSKSSTSTKSRKNENTASKLPHPSKKSKSQKQSLILLEEVDVLFEEDKQFWSTVITLLFQSRRPIIMTCNDEARLPLDELALHAIFRFTPPPEPVATDYLLLLAANEGHLLSRAAVSTLYKAKHFDLRASIVELNFWCQMAIGDAKGGLDWLPITSPSSTYYSAGGEKQRVVSEDTYLLGMGLFDNNFSGVTPTSSVSEDIDLLAAALNEHDIDVEDWQELISVSALAYATSNTLPHDSLLALRRAERFFDGISSGDVLPCTRTRSVYKTLIDTTVPVLPENALRNYTEGLHLLQADPVQDTGGTNTLVALSLKACSRKVMFTKGLEQCVIPLDAAAITSLILQRSRELKSHESIVSMNIATAFGPLVDLPKSSAVHMKGPQISIFDGPISAIVQDAAPYVRSIVSYDLQLEAQRLRLGNLLSQGGRSGKRQRTTRASRAALEGGSKAHTRRDRWFSKDTNFSLVLQTGGKEWQGAMRQQQIDDMAQSDNDLEGSRRSSPDILSIEL